MVNLPRYFALESLSNNKYLSYIHDESLISQQHLEFSGEEVLSPYTKYELEPAELGGDRGLFSIRCCYNNRYWMRRDKSTTWITATATEPIEDQLNWSCTLFKLTVEVSDDGKSMLRLYHVRPGYHYAPVSVSTSFPSCLEASLDESLTNYEVSNTSPAFSIIDWESFVILPKLVVFKADNGLYLRCIGNSLRFDSSDVSLRGTSNQVLYTRDGSVRIFLADGCSWYTNKFDLITTLVSTGPMPDDGRDLFWLVKGRGDDEVAIRSKTTTLFCRRPSPVDAIDNNHHLRANAFSVVKDAIMRVEEPVFSRTVYNVDFHLKHARIYDQSDVILVNKQSYNMLDTDQVNHLAQTFTKETTRTWNSSVTLMLATPTKIKTRIPVIIDGEVGFSDEFEGRYEWGTDIKGSQTIELSVDINIPPRSNVKAQVIATKAKCDVPFSYTQRDVLTDGTIVINKKDDGVYTGINWYNLKTNIIKKKELRLG